MKITTIIGARPQFIKAAMISHAIAEYNQRVGHAEVEEIILHTGQHYDDYMSAVFLRSRSPRAEVQPEYRVRFSWPTDWSYAYGDRRGSSPGKA